MASKNEQNIKLPQFVIESELSRKICTVFPEGLINTPCDENIVFDWSDVDFFDDYALLKLVFLQKHIRMQGSRVKNRGFHLSFLSPQKQSVLRQLLECSPSAVCWHFATMFKHGIVKPIWILHSRTPRDTIAFWKG